MDMQGYTTFQGISGANEHLDMVLYTSMHTYPVVHISQILDPETADTRPPGMCPLIDLTIWLLSSITTTVDWMDAWQPLFCNVEEEETKDPLFCSYMYEHMYEHENEPALNTCAPPTP